MITNIHRNGMGTIDFDGKFAGMRKAQEFIVYPMKEESTVATIQSDTRIGTIDLTSGTVAVCPPQPRGAYFMHLGLRMPAGTLSAEDLFNLKAHIFGSASGKAGTNGVVYTDNSGALEVFK